MTKGKNSSRKNPRRRDRQGAPAQRAGPRFNQVARVPWRFPLFPRQLQFSSKFQQTIEIALGATQYNRRCGLYSFNNQLPLYVLSMYDLYRYCRITGIHVKLTLSPDETTAGAAIEMAMARIPFDEGASITPALLHEVRGSRYRLVSGALGAIAQSIDGSYASFDELGNPVYDKSFWQTRSEAVSTILDPDEPVVAVAVRGVVGGSATVAINLEITYHMEFFDLHISDDLVSNKGFKNPEQESRTRPRVRETRECPADDSFTRADGSDSMLAPKRRR